MSSSTVVAPGRDLFDRESSLDQELAAPRPVGFVDIEAAGVAVARLRVAARARAAAEAELAAAAVGVADLCDDRNYDSLEVAAVLTWTPRFAGVEVEWCRLLITELSVVFVAWSAGRIDRHKARVFVDCLSVLLLGGRSDEARRIAAAVLPQAPGWTASRLRARLLRLALRVDPAAARKRVEATIADRGVWLSNDSEDGATGSLSAFNLPVARAAAAFERVDAIARARRAGGDSRTLAQLRADTVLDLLDGTGCDTTPISRHGIVELQIPLATALGAGVEPGELAGYGPVLADVARQIARDRGDAQWRFSVTYKGELVYQGLTRARPQPTPRPGTETVTKPVQQAGPPAGRGRDLRGAIPERRGRGPGADGATSSTVRASGETAADAADDRSRAGRAAAATNRGSAADARAGGHHVAGSRPVGGAAAGVGAVSRDVAGGAGSRDVARGAGFVDVQTGEPITGVSVHTPHPPVEADPRRRLPGEKLKRWIAARDRTCRAPGCQAPARVCEYDHTVDYADGGDTTAEDLELLCEYHHALKHAGWWTVIQPTAGEILWITPHGHTYQQPPD